MNELPFVLWVNRVIKAAWRMYRIDVYSMPHIDYWGLYRMGTGVDRAAWMVSLAVD